MGRRSRSSAVDAAGGRAEQTALLRRAAAAPVLGGSKRRGQAAVALPELPRVVATCRAAVSLLPLAQPKGGGGYRAYTLRDDEISGPGSLV